MKSWFKKLPLPVSGLMLGLAALGNLLGPYHAGTKSVLGLAAGTLMLLLALKVVLFPACLKEGFRHPLTASAMATFPMSVMLLSTYVRQLLPVTAYIAWQLALVLSVFLIVLFTRTYLLHLSLQNVYPSWFVLYVGIAVASVTAPVYGMELLGQRVFWLGLVLYLLLLPLVTYRILRGGNLPEPARPTLIIYAAPASLLINGYFASFPVKDEAVLFPLSIWALLMTIFSLVQMMRLLMIRLPFSPSFSAFTFPFVMSAIAFSRMTGYLTGAGYASTWFAPVRTFMVLGSTLAVLFVFFQYVWFMTGHDMAAAVLQQAALSSKVSSPSLDGDILSLQESGVPKAGHPVDQDVPAPSNPAMDIPGFKEAFSSKEKAV